MKTVSILIPVKNEQVALPHVLGEVFRVTPALSRRYAVEVIVVDDHSTDATGSRARQYPVRVVETARGSGKGRAIATGFARARGDYIVTLDGDYSHQARDIPRLVAPLDGGAGLVIGSRILGGAGEPVSVRSIGNTIITAMLNVCLGTHLTDALSGFKALRREIARDFPYTSSEFEIEIEIIANALRKNLAIVEVASRQRPRMGGVSKSSVIRHGIRIIFRILVECFRGSHPPSHPA